MPPAEPIVRVRRPDAGANPLRPGRELLLSFAFRCNFACTFCYVEDGLAGRYRGVSLEDARRLLADPRLTEGVTRIVLSGGEVTLDRELPAFIALARAVPSVAHVRIQTNASRLADDGLAARLVDLGVDELFVSLHAADAARSDAITQRPGSFAAILAGLDAARAAGAAIITNTVVCATNVDQLAAIIALAHDRGAQAAELWGYVPRVDADDARRLLVRVTDAAPHVRAALAAAEARALPVTVKYFPRCLLGRFASAQSDAQPRLVIDDAFWKSYPQYGCLYEGVCAAAVADGCSGLSDAYVRRFGWEEDALRPFGEDAPRDPAPVIAAYHSWAHAPTTSRGAPDTPDAPDAPDTIDAPDAPDAPDTIDAPTATDAIDAGEAARLLAVLGLVHGAALAGARIAAPARTVDGVRLRFITGDAAGAPLAIDLRPRDPARPCFARTATLDLIHPPWTDAATARARPLLAALASHLTARDDGGLARALRPSPPSAEVRRADTIASTHAHAGWPAPVDPRAAEFHACVLALRAAAHLGPATVEPSVALGRPDEWRLLVNPSVRRAGVDRAAQTGALLTTLDAPGWLHDLARRWLDDAGRSLFIGVAAAALRVRTKLYLPVPNATTRAAAAALLARATPAAEVAIVAIDVEGGALIAHKDYARLAPTAARAEFAGPLLALVEERGLLLGELPLLRARRSAPDEQPIDAALHVDVRAFPQLELGVAWATACGDHAAAARLAGRTARVLSATGGDRGPCHVYLADDLEESTR